MRTVVLSGCETGQAGSGREGPPSGTPFLIAGPNRCCLAEEIPTQPTAENQQRLYAAFAEAMAEYGRARLEPRAELDAAAAGHYPC